MEKSLDANRLVEARLTEYLREVGETVSADCMTYVGPITHGVDNNIRAAIEVLRGREKRRAPRLLVILETTGGYAEVTRRISDILRHHYRVVDFLIPSHAFSAGTILAMSGDSIWMDYYSVLGPIDPQVSSQEGNHSVPALGYLERYNDLLNKANTRKISGAELRLLLSFDQGELYAFSQARDLSVSLLEEWLVKYKFKNWKVTASTKRPVTPTMRKERAKEVADKLNDIKRWNSHGIGINKDTLEKELKIMIDDFGKQPALNDRIRAYHGLLTDYMARLRQRAIIHTRESYTVLSGE